MIHFPRVLLVEDNSQVSAAICAIMISAGYSDLEVAETAAVAERRVRLAHPDLVLVDLGLPDRDGADLILALRTAAFREPILVLTSATSDARVLEALRAGADGYLFKEDLDTGLAVALRDLSRGGMPLSPGAAKAVLAQLRSDRRADAPTISSRELSVLELLATGASYAEIAQMLGVALNTVRTHVRSLYEKMGVENRAEAVNLAWTSGLLRETR